MRWVDGCLHARTSGIVPREEAGKCFLDGTIAFDGPILRPTKHCELGDDNATVRNNADLKHTPGRQLVCVFARPSLIFRQSKRRGIAHQVMWKEIDTRCASEEVDQCLISRRWAPGVELGVRLER